MPLRRKSSLCLLYSPLLRLVLQMRISHLRMLQRCGTLREKVLQDIDVPSFRYDVPTLAKTARSLMIVHAYFHTSIHHQYDKRDEERNDITSILQGLGTTRCKTYQQTTTFATFPIRKTTNSGRVSAIFSPSLWFTSYGSSLLDTNDRSSIFSNLIKKARGDNRELMSCQDLGFPLCLPRIALAMR